MDCRDPVTMAGGADQIHPALNTDDHRPPERLSALPGR